MILEARGIRRSFDGRPVLEGVSLSVAAGELIVLLGRNGSGKTTLLRSLAGVLAAGDGFVLLDGRDLTELSPRERALRIGYLPQLHEIPLGFSVEALVEMGRHPHAGEGQDARRRAVLDALAAVGAVGLSGRRIETLSGGELQKAFLASVVAQDTPVLLLDEPTVFLDPGWGAEIQRALLRLAAGGRALLVATHDLEFAGRCATRAAGLKGGAIIFDGPPAAVLRPRLMGELYGVDFAAAGRPLAGRDPEAPPAPPSARQPGPPRLEEAAAPEPLLGAAGVIADAVRRPPPLLVLLSLACIVFLAIAPFFGPATGSLSGEPPAMGGAGGFILWQLRVPRVLLGAIAGAGLALAGAAFQALFRNPLATPYTLGVASGAAFGAVLALLAGAASPIGGLSGTSLGALAGALGLTAAVYGLGRRRNALPTATLLLAGVTLSFFFSALILLLQYLADFTEVFRMLRWLMGEVRVVGYAPFAVLGPLAAAGGLLILTHGADLNLLLTGEELAQARGVNVESVKRRLFLGSSLLVGGVVALCGPIGFVGLIVPHALRSLLGPDHRRLLPACIPAGASFLVACDSAARLLLAPAELPVGVVTALLGGPFFLAILMRRGLPGAG